MLGSNTDSATRFGSDMQGLSSGMRHGLQRMSTVQGDFGRELQFELEAYTLRGREVSERSQKIAEHYRSLNETWQGWMLRSHRSTR